MGRILIPGLPAAEPAVEPWPTDEHSIRVDEMFARQLDTEFASGVRGLLHRPETGLSALKGEAALEAIAGAMPALVELKDRTLAQAIGPRQRSILEPMIETRLDWAAGTIGQLAHRATVEVDDASVADRFAGLNQDAATAWRDPAYLRKLGRTAVEELRYQGERRAWDPAETDAKVRSGLSDLYAGSIEAAIGQEDLDGAAALYDHARPVLDPDRQAVLDKRFAREREVALYRDIDRDLAGLPLGPAEPPGLEVFERRATELTPDDASDTVRAGIAQVAEHAQRQAERQWNRQQAEAGVAALDWFRKNPQGSFLAIPSDVRDWLAPDQWQGLETLAIEGRLATDGALFERLDRQMVHEPEAFATLDLDRHRLSLGDADYTRFAGAQRLSQPQAQKLVDLYAGKMSELVQRQMSAAESRQKAWVTEVKNDPELGGRRFESARAAAQRALGRFGTPELRRSLDELGVSSSPQLFRFFVRVGRAVSEDRYVGAQTDASRLSAAETLYPDNRIPNSRNDK